MSSNYQTLKFWIILEEGPWWINLSLMQRWLNDEISDVETGAFECFESKELYRLRTKFYGWGTLKRLRITSKTKFVFSRYLWNRGDGANTFNISTAVAFVAASCGVNIAKHGNKSASGKVGSADVLLNLGLDLNCSLEKVITAVSEIGIFCSHLFGINR